jgi:integrase
MIYQNINFNNNGQIHVEAWMSKTKRERYVTITPTLKTWLETYPLPKQGAIITENFQRRFDRIRVKCGYYHWKQNKTSEMKWSQDAVRHNFGTYWLALNDNRFKFAEEMGNSPAVISKHYRRAVLPSEAEEYWNILPT